MKTQSIHVLNLVKTLNDNIEDGLGVDILSALINKYLKDEPVDLMVFFSDFIEEDWVKRKLLMDINSRLQNLEMQLRVTKRRFAVNTFTVSDLGVTLYGHS